MPKKRSRPRTSVAAEYLIALELAVDAARRLLDDPPLRDETRDSSAGLLRSYIHRNTLEGTLSAVESTRGRRRPATFANTEETET